MTAFDSLIHKCWLESNISLILSHFYSIIWFLVSFDFSFLWDIPSVKPMYRGAHTVFIYLL